MGFLSGGTTVNIPPPTTLDIPTVQAQAAQAAQSNLTNSLAMQSQVFPTLNATQNAGINAAGNIFSNPVMFNPAALAPLGSNPALNSAAQYATNQLALGNQLPPDVAAQVQRAAGASAFGSGLRGAGLSDITAADLGLNSLQLGQQRFANASQVGGQVSQQNAAQQALATSLAEFNSQYGASIPLQNNSQQLAAAGLLTGIPLPASGLDPGSIAGLAAANVSGQNAYNQQTAAAQAQQANANNAFWGQLLGTGLSLATAFA